MTGNPATDHMLAAALEAATLAGAVCRFVQHRAGGPTRITKPDNSPVTIADFAAQAVVARTFHRRLGSVPLVGEESAGFLRQPGSRSHLDEALAALHDSGAWPDATAADVLDAIDHGAAEGPTPSAFWTVDPIDGTKGFLRGHQYCVCIARIEDQQPTIGVLCCPNLSADFQRPFSDRDPHGVTLFAVRGGGAFCRPADSPSAPPTRLGGPAEKPAGPPRITESVSTGHSDRTAFAAVCSRLNPPGVGVHLDSQCKYAVVARGQADAYLRIPPRPGYAENIWDHAPGILLTREVGCSTSDVFGRPLVFGPRKLEGAVGIIAARPHLHTQMLEAARAAAPDRLPR